MAELAVATAIIALLLFGALVPFSAQVEIRNVAETRRTMDSIKEAIIGFAQANGRLPCPASGTILSGAADALGRPAGSEQLTSFPPTPGAGCTNVFGVVPWATLGVPETDSWGRRFSYWVTPIYADGLGPPTTFGCAPSPPPTQSSFALCSVGTLTVNTRSADINHTLNPLVQSLPLVFISHGKNGFGAFTPGGTLISTAAAGADETANATHTPAATTFFSRTPTGSATGCNDNTPGSPLCEFDDVVTWITSSTLSARMVAAGRLP